MSRRRLEATSVQKTMTLSNFLCFVIGLLWINELVQRWDERRLQDDHLLGGGKFLDLIRDNWTSSGTVDWNRSLHFTLLCPFDGGNKSSGQDWRKQEKVEFICFLETVAARGSFIGDRATGMDWSVLSRCTVQLKSPNEFHSYSRELTGSARTRHKLCTRGLVPRSTHEFVSIPKRLRETLRAGRFNYTVYIGVERSNTFTTHSNANWKNPPIQVHSPLIWTECVVRAAPKPPTFTPLSSPPPTPRMDGPSEAVNHCMENMVTSRLEAPFVAFNARVLGRLLWRLIVWSVDSLSTGPRSGLRWR